MEIREATAEDVAGVLPMVARICAYHEGLDPEKYCFLPHPEERYRGWLKSRAADPQSVFLVAERERRLVAFLVGQVEAEIPIYRITRYGFVHDLWVEPEYRNEGIARQLAMLAVEKFREMGVPQVRLDTAAGNDAARKLFEACGFRTSRVEMLLDFGA
jgi:ribosomal protein S18 acetylase RimI-like enzyme